MLLPTSKNRAPPTVSVLAIQREGPGMLLWMLIVHINIVISLVSKVGQLPSPLLYETIPLVPLDTRLREGLHAGRETGRSRPPSSPVCVRDFPLVCRPRAEGVWRKTSLTPSHSCPGNRLCNGWCSCRLSVRWHCGEPLLSLSHVSRVSALRMTPSFSCSEVTAWSLCC